MKTDNELIAEFMGLPLTTEVPAFTGGFLAVPFQNWKYHQSWDWLMPVVEKIESIEGMYVRIQRDRCIMFDSGFGESDIIIREQRQPNQYPSASINQPSKIEAVYKAVVDFIKWYNSQTKEEKDA